MNKKCLKDFDFVKKYFDYFSSDKYNEDLINNLRVHYRGKKSVAIETIENTNEETESDSGKQIVNLNYFLENVGFKTLEEGKLLKSEIEFLTGGWFEEYVYYKIKSKYKFTDDEILLGVILEKSDITNKNDLDVVVVKNNKFIVIECKTGMKIDGKVALLFNETVYKAAALKKNFGLHVASYLFTLEDLSMNDYLKKADVLGIKAIDKAQIKDESVFDNILNNF